MYDPDSKIESPVGCLDRKSRSGLGSTFEFVLSQESDSKLVIENMSRLECHSHILIRISGLYRESG